MTDMIERIAKAIQAAANDASGSSDECCTEEMSLAAARAALEAMREPTEAMCEAGGIYSDYSAASLGWVAMIDVALQERS